MKKVLYLCPGSEDSDSLFFAPELPENHYAPGQFFIEARTPAGKPHELYRFAAMQGSQELEFELRPAKNGRSYSVDAGENGKFFFKIVAINRSIRYIGKNQENFDGMPLYRVEPANMQQLEQACRKNDFYFIGSSSG